jgi:tRNA nucleotidyltransferase (CCA-adding enzyme)
MEIYLVGGAVRDALLGLPVKERDWVVVGATPEELTRAGYQLVGRDFPVFLHPQTHEEYALARVERKTAPGYHGFSVHYAPDVTLVEDLRRRDLTINAIARGADGALHDPYGGCADLEGRLLRHVSEAFAEDPVRILRVARFAARFAALGFSVAAPTLALMGEMVRAGEASALVPERVWAETAKALSEARPAVYFEVLERCGALNVVYPELARLLVPRERFAAALAALDGTAALGAHLRVRLAVLLLSLADPVAVEALCVRAKVPTDYRDLATLVTRARPQLDGIAHAPAAQVVQLLESLDAFRRAERFAEACEAWDCAGAAARDVARLRDAHAAAAGTTLSAADRQGLAGPAIGGLLRDRRIAAVAALPV